MSTKLLPLVILQVVRAAEEEEAPVKKEGCVVLLGSVAFVMTTFYLTNAYHVELRGCAWSMISAAVSIFCAVMSYNAVNAVIHAIFQLPPAEDPPSGADITSYVLQMALWWFLIITLFFISKKSPLHMKGYGTIGGHIMGFAAIAAFGNLAQTEQFRNSPWMTLLIWLMYPFIVTLFIIPGKLVQNWLVKSGRLSSTENDAWHDQSQDTGTDFISMGLAFIMSMFIRFLVSGKIPSVEEMEDTHSTHEVATLLAIGVGLVGAAGLVAKAAHGKEGMSWDVLSTTTAILGGFCVLFGFHWHFYNSLGNTLMGRLLIALCISTISIFWIIISWRLKVNGVSQSALDGAFTAVSLTVGLSWEKCFDKALDDLGDDIGDSGSASKTWIMVALVLIVFPAWMVYMLPKNDEELKKAIPMLADGPLPCQAFFCDQRIYDDVATDDDVEEDNLHGDPRKLLMAAA